MEQLPLSLTELLQIVLYFSAPILLVGTTVQIFIIYIQDRQFSRKLLLHVLATQLIVFAATLWLWLKWQMGLRIMFGPILIPALISEIIILPVMLNLFHYKIWGRKSSDNKRNL